MARARRRMPMARANTMRSTPRPAAAPAERVNPPRPTAERGPVMLMVTSSPWRAADPGAFDLHPQPCPARPQQPTHDEGIVGERGGRIEQSVEQPIVAGAREVEPPADRRFLALAVDPPVALKVEDLPLPLAEFHRCSLGRLRAARKDRLRHRPQRRPSPRLMCPLP